MRLRSYQQKAFEQTKGLLQQRRRPLLYAPTGAGKTRLAAEVLASFPSNAPKLFVVHTDQLQVQAKAVLTSHGIGAHVVTIQSLLLNSSKFDSAEIVCWDECHHLRGEQWGDAVQLFGPDTAMFGLSATPFATELDQIFDEWVTVAKIEDLIGSKHLMPIDIARPRDDWTQDGVINGAIAYCQDFSTRHALHFERDTKMCEKALEVYQSRGVQAEIVTNRTGRKKRESILADFRSGSLRVLISPVLLTEGFDAPIADTMIAGRSFKSPTLLTQAVGRIRRPHPGKISGLVVDCSGCCADLSGDYFNRTDLTLRTTLKNPSEREPDGLPRPRREIEWLTPPPGGWVIEEAQRVEIERVEAETKEVSKAKQREYDREYRRSPEYKAKQREYQQSPEYKAKQREYRRSTEYKRSPEYKAKRREYKRSTEYKAKQREYKRLYWQRKKLERSFPCQSQR